MKCPKCNYVSHDYLEACRKCGVDLMAFKQEIGLIVVQPGVLDLSLVLGGAGADDLFESVEDEVIMHASDDDDFDISLDDYVDQPGLRRPFSATSRGGGRTADDDPGGLDHLTLELDAADLPANLAARLRASQSLPDTLPMPPPPVPSRFTAEEEETLPGRVTLDTGRDNISAELPSEIQQEAVRLASPLPPAASAPAREEPQERLQISRALGFGVGGLGFAGAAAAAAHTQETPLAPPVEEVSLPLPLDTGNIDFTAAEPQEAERQEDEALEVDTVVNVSGPMPSLPLHDVVLADEPDVGRITPEAVDPTIPTIELLDVDVAVTQRDAELRGEPPVVAEAPGAMLNSFELTVDDSVFALGVTSEVLSDAPEVPALDLDTEVDLDLDVEYILPTIALDETPPADAASGLPAASLASLDESSLMVTDDEPQAAFLSSTLPLAEPSPGAEENLTPSDMLVLEDLGDDTLLPGHLTLEMPAFEFPDALVSQVFDGADLGTCPEVLVVPDAAPLETEHSFTASDALALGDLADTGDALPEHLTIELDISELSAPGSTTLEDVQLAELPEAWRSASAAAPAEPQDHDESELLLDLDDFEFIDEDSEQK